MSRRNGSRRAGTTLRRRLEVTLVGVALVSVLLLSGMNYVFARALVSDSLSTQLGSLRDTRVQTMERAATRLQSSVSTLGVTPSVIAALTELSAAYQEIDTELPTSDFENIVASYERLLEPARVIEPDIDARSLVPASDAGRYLQQHYIVDNPNEFDDRDRLDDADDGSAYSAVHAEYHPLLRALMSNAEMSDLLLVDAETREVVYTTKKRMDLGAKLADGPYSETQLGAVFDQLSNVAVGETVISDSSFYIPARGEAVMFFASAVRSGSEVIGAVITELPVAAVTSLVTGDESWESLGLGTSGDIYIVGADGTMRTDPRPFLDDPAGFLEDNRDRFGDGTLAEKIETTGSAALLVNVDNAAVDAAQVGDDFVGSVEGPFGQRTLAASAPVVVGDLDWVVVVEQNRDETAHALASLLRSTLIVVAILLPITALLGVLLARSLTRPFEAVVAAAGRIARGEPAGDVEDLGSNEIGDVGRQLQLVAGQLEAQERAIVVEEQHITDVLAAALPPRLVDRVRRGEQSIDDIVDDATVVSMTVDQLPEAAGSDQDVVVEIVSHIGDEIDALLERFDVERIRRTSASALFVLGLDQSDARVSAGAEFAAAVVDLIAEVGTEYGQTLTARAGISSGEVATGVIGRGQLSFGVWGDPVGVAETLVALAQPGEILVDATVVEHLGGEWVIGSGERLPGLDDDVAAHAITRRGREADDS